jgi:RND family efflux transporter MFP subunit
VANAARNSVLLLLALFGAPGCGVSDSDAKASGDAEADAPPAARVRIAVARSGVLRDRSVFLGEARPLLQAALAAGADAEITAVLVREGDRVAEGDVLVRLDPSLAAARVAAARASRSQTAEELRQARRDRVRAERLGRDILPEAEIERDVSITEQLDARAAALKAAEREAKAQLGRHQVVAPFAGVIAHRLVDPGDWVGPGDTVIELVDDEKVEVIVAGSAELVQRVQRGTKASVRLGVEEVPAEIVGIVRALDPATRTATLRLLPDSVPDWLLPGVSVDVAFDIEHDDDGVLVPRDAIVYGPAGNRVVVVRNGLAETVPIEVVATADVDALVRGEGLAAGDEVVVRGNERLRPGQPVVLDDEDAKAEP